MTKNQIRSFRNALTRWYEANQRDLPWRRTRDPYAIWVSEVMLQQTQVNTVLPYYRHFLKRFPTVRDLAQADLQGVLKAWEGMGYYGRARNLHAASQRVVREYGGVVPAQWKDFRSLSGVGDYIASAVLSMAHGQPYAVIDGNVKRVFSRLLLLEHPVNQTASLKPFRKAAEKFLDREDPGTFNQALMELGAMVCRPRQPRCSLCPVSTLCRAYQSDRILAFPKRLKKNPTPLHPIAAGIVFRNGQVLITRRKPEGLLGGLWEFPGGKIRKGETAQSACLRELAEEVNLKVRIDAHLCRVRHAYTHFRIVMDVFCCSHISGSVRLNGPVDHRWIALAEVADYPLPKANHKFIPQLKEYASQQAGFVHKVPQKRLNASGARR